MATPKEKNLLYNYLCLLHRTDFPVSPFLLETRTFWVLYVYLQIFTYSTFLGKIFVRYIERSQRFDQCLVQECSC